MRLIDADELLKAYDSAHEGEPGKARQLIIDAPTVGGWISVKDRMPGEWMTVLTFQPALSDGWGLIRTAVYIGTGKWREAERHELMELPVTHWMPLPEPPK